ncbi:hypothetical protein AKJ49_00400 [candidate division MSBL1 archaeon SCGC-AAA382A03]|uniref:Radical SAM core domain-containing protein n=1 Tax=candidate division MSBL1 archaeon SCGC-AAA382A03 TaxID=1698278 RepID=A0A133VGS9_9EURY|nr:hypothetical protein AKJ49_00400 [candidate division MSBL1 archaeon SCGC-AAA382A03]
MKKVCRGNFDKADLEILLNPETKEERKLILQTAREIKEKYFSKKFFLYGFVNISTICKNNCSFCFYRKKNTKSIRYRKSKEEILKASKHLVREGVNLIDLTLGEDPYYDENFEELVDIVSSVSELDVPVMISPGVRDKSEIERLRDAGATWFALYQETHTSELYDRLRLNQSFKEREEARENAADVDMLVEDGILLGVGENKRDIANSILAMKNEPLAQVRCMPFVTHEGIPLQKQELAGDYALITALLRITNPRKLVPASLDIEGLKGIKGPIEAGANVITSIIPSNFNLAGVAQSEYGIENEERSPKNVRSFLRKRNLEHATTEELFNFCGSTEILF